MKETTLNTTAEVLHQKALGDPSTQVSASGLSRRQWMMSSGALVVSASASGFLGLSALSASVDARAQASGVKPAMNPDELDSWVAIAPDGGVTAFFGKVDLGQGLVVALAQMVAEELDVAYERVNIVLGSTDKTVNQGGASSALGIQAGSKPLVQAAAEARRLLVEMAALQLGTTTADLVVNNGVVSSKSQTGKTVSYQDLIGGKYFNSKVEWNKKLGNPLEIKGKATLKKPVDYKIVGQPIPRTDLAWRIYGTGEFVSDIRVPGVLHARMVRTPMAGATIASVDESSIQSVPGAKVVRQQNFLAVVAEKEWDAVKAARLLKVKWTPPQYPMPANEENLYEHLRLAAVVKREEEVKVGDVSVAFKAAKRIISAEYHWPFQSHASMGPACAIADVKPEGVTLWTSSQKPHFARDGVANLLGIDPKMVTGHWVIGPGSYGRNDAGDAVMDAAMLSKLTGRPVRVQGMRHDGTLWDPKAPASIHTARAALDENGVVIGYEFVSKGFSRVSIESNEADPNDSLVGMEMGLPARNGVGFGVPGDAYKFPAKLQAWEVVPDLIKQASPLRTSHMRDPVGLQIQFASEQFMDEVAFEAGLDPIAFRMRYAPSARDQDLFAQLRDKSNWQTRRAYAGPQKGRILKGQGVAYAHRGGTILAAVAHIEVDRQTGRIWARKFTVAHDCGLIINPKGIQYTIEGALVQALSRTLYEEVHFDEHQVKSVDWLTYPILTIHDTPESVDLVLINRPELPPTGAGEATNRLIPASVANAFFDATGVRMRQAPLTPKRVLAALKDSSAKTKIS